jgi:hypothetical protein
MIEAKVEREDLIARAAIMAARPDRESCGHHQRQVRAYRSLVAEINALTDSDMELALLSR